MTRTAVLALSAAVSVLLLPFARGDSTCPNFVCKNASSDWPRCRPPTEGFRLRFGEGSKDARFPVTAWWGPLGYAGPDTSKELEAYAKAGFTIALVGDRGSDRCTNNATADAIASWDFVSENVKRCEKLGLQVLIDSYRCRPWGGLQNAGGNAQGPVGGFVSRTANHKITLPEVQWLATRLQEMPAAVGILITDDGVDLADNEIKEIQWMRENTPELYPWVNQCGDGSVWLARAGTPYAVPELYSVGKNWNTDPLGAAQAQLRSYDDWMDKSNRYGLKFWPLINVGDGGDTGLVGSKSLVLFQGYSSLAYGALGLNWYCWGQGIWNLTAQGPTGIYDAVQSVNLRVNNGGHWSKALLGHGVWEGVYHTGWELEGGASSWEPGPTQIVTAMDTDLLAGVLASPSDGSSLLLVVADKRVTSDHEAPPSRSVSIKINSKLAAGVIVLPGGTAHVDSTGHTVVAELEGGEGILVQLSALPNDHGLRAAAYALRRWRFSDTSPDLNAVKTTQYQFYNHYYQARTQTSFIIGLLDGLSHWQRQGETDAQVASLADAGFNVVAVPSEHLQATLNAGLRQGVFVLSAPDGHAWTTAFAAAALVRSMACHPNLLGLWLGDQPLNTSDPDSVAAVHGSRALLQHDASHLVNLVAVTSAQEVLHAAAKTGLPTIALALPRNTSASAQDNMIFVARESSALRSILASSLVPAAFILEWQCLDAGAASPAAIRFGAFAATAFGARGFLLQGLALCEQAARQVTTKLGQWGDRLLGLHLAGVLNTGWPIVGTGGSFNGSSLVVGQDADLLLAIFWSSSGSAAPPIMLAVDMRDAGEERTAEIRLDAASVYGWTAYIGDAAAGFGSCNKITIGSKVRIVLEPGDAVLFTITMFSPDPESTNELTAPDLVI